MKYKNRCKINSIKAENFTKKRITTQKQHSTILKKVKRKIATKKKKARKNMKRQYRNIKPKLEGAQQRMRLS